MLSALVFISETEINLFFFQYFELNITYILVHMAVIKLNMILGFPTKGRWFSTDTLDASPIKTDRLESVIKHQPINQTIYMPVTLTFVKCFHISEF